MMGNGAAGNGAVTAAAAAGGVAGLGAGEMGSAPASPIASYAGLGFSSY